MCLQKTYFVFHSLPVQRNNFCLCSVLFNMSFHFDDDGLVFIPFISSPLNGLSVLFLLFHIQLKQVSKVSWAWLSSEACLLVRKCTMPALERIAGSQNVQLSVSAE